MSKNIIAKANLASSKPLIIHNRNFEVARSLARDLSTTEYKDRVRALPDFNVVVRRGTLFFVCVSDDVASREVVDTIFEETTQQTAEYRKLIVNCSTIHPQSARDLADYVNGTGLYEYVSMPIFGTPAVAHSGNLICVLSGSNEAVSRVKPFCSGVMGRAVIDLSSPPGEDYDVGRAPTLKLLGNSMLFQMIHSLAETFVAAERTDVGMDHMKKLVDILFGGVYTTYAERMITAMYMNKKPLFDNDLALKDAKYALDVAKNSGVSLDGLELVSQGLEKTKEQFEGEKVDVAGLYGTLRAEAGLDVDVSKVPDQ